MKVRRFTSLFLGALALLAATPAYVAEAQTVGEGGAGTGGGAGVISPPPERLMVTPGGVDMRSGEYNYEQTDVSIGEDNEQGGLELTRSMKSDVVDHISPFANFSHNWEIMLTEKLVKVLDGNYTHGSGTDQFMGVHFGGRSESFETNIFGSGYRQVSRTTQARLTATGTAGAAIFTFQATDGTLAIFRPIGNQDCSSYYRCAYVSYMVLPDGTRFDFAYENPTPGVANTTRLRRVTSSRGYALLLEYDAANWNQVGKSCVLNLTLVSAPSNNVCPVSALATATYSYSGSGAARRLASVTDPLGAISSFTYTPVATGTQMAFIRPGQSTPWLTNTFSLQPNNDGETDEIINRQDFADGSSFVYSYTYSPDIEGQFATIAGGTYTNALAETVTLEYGFEQYPGSLQGPAPQNCCDIRYQISPGPIRVTDALGRVTITDYCDPNAMANLPPYEHHRCLVWPVPYIVTNAEGVKVQMTWDLQTRNLLQSRQKAIAGTGLTDIVSSSIFDCSLPINCAKPTSHTDARGNVTNYTYSPVHGGVLTETGPAVDVVSAAGTVTAGVRPQTRYDYVQRYAWISNGAGGYVQAATPVWLLNATSSCRTSAATGNASAPCAASGDEVTTSYDYGPNAGPNSLLLRGQVVTADGVSLRTCYSYDQRGRRISETQPNANLTSCP